MTWRSNHRCTWEGESGLCSRGYEGEPKAAAWAVVLPDTGQAHYACFDHLAAVCGQFKEYDELTLHRISFRGGFKEGWRLTGAEAPLGRKIHPGVKRRL